jgi:uncharacterized protein DUF3750
VLLLAAGCAPLDRLGQNWWELRRDSSDQTPDPASTPDAVIQVYAARAVGWRGVMAVHTWVAVKPTGAAGYTRYEVMGWGVGRGAPAIRVNRAGPDDYWFGSRPELLVDRRGEGVDALISHVQAAVETYPYPASYRTWPGPNSNTFIAYIGREVPELQLNMPSNAIGKDFLPNWNIVAMTPSGTGAQFSLLGVAGILVGADEGIEVNVLGFALGIDVLKPALKLPGIGRVGFD